MRGTWWTVLPIGAAALSLAIVDGPPAPAGDRVARLNQALAQHERSLQRDARTGYLVSVLDALAVPAESQLLVSSKTGVQRAYTDMDARLLRYPCSYMIYSDAFEGLPAAIKQTVYRRMIAALTADEPLATRARLDDRRAVLEILAQTKPDFSATR